MTFLHFTSIEQIDWHDYTGEKQVELVICIVVLREINKHKYDPKHQGCARRASRFLLDNDGKEVRAGVTLRLLVDAAPTEDTVADHQFLTIVQKYIADHSTEKVAIFTEDIELRLLCKAAQVPVIEPMESDLLPLPQDETVKKLRAAESELAKLKNRLPDFEITVFGGEELHVPQRLQAMTPDQISDFFNQTWPRNEPHLIPRMTNGMETNRSGYYKLIERHAEARNKWVEKHGLVYPFRFLVENTGTDVATGIHLWLEFPAPISLCAQSTRTTTTYRDCAQRRKTCRECRRTTFIFSEAAPLFGMLKLKKKRIRLPFTGLVGKSARFAIPFRTRVQLSFSQFPSGRFAVFKLSMKSMRTNSANEKEGR